MDRAIRRWSWGLLATAWIAALLAFSPARGLAFNESVQHWAQEFPKTDFIRRTVDLSEIKGHGATRNSIRPIVDPEFVPVARVEGIGAREPVVTLVADFVARAYPIRMLIWHEIVNDVVSGKPVVVAYSPLSNSAAAYLRRVEGREVLFGNTGRLRHFNLIMYDTGSESWWQQFSGSAILGSKAGITLERLVTKVQSLERFRDAYPDGEVMVPKDPKAMAYGTTPYVHMDRAGGKGLGGYLMPRDVKPFERVVIVGEDAWTLKRLREKGAYETDDLYIGVVPGQNSAHDAKWISFGRDVGNVVVRRRDADSGEWIDTAHDVTFAFLFKAFHPAGVLYTW